MSRRLSYVLFQTRVSSNVALDTLQPSADGPWDLDFVVEDPAEFRDDASIEWLHQYFIRGTSVLAATSGREADGFVVRRHGVADFHITREGRAVRAVPLPGAPPAAVEDAFIGELFPLVLNLRGRNGIHASAVRTRDGAIAFCGASRAGKSTIAAYLRASGYPVVTDDYLGLEDCGGEIVGFPGLCDVRVRPDSREALRNLASATRRHEAVRVNVTVAEPPTSSEAEPVVMKRIYYLPSRDALGSSGGVRIKRLAGGEAFTEVLQQMHRLDLQDREMLTAQTDLVARLAALGRIRCLMVGSFDSLRDLPNVIDADLTEAIAAHP